MHFRSKCFCLSKDEKVSEFFKNKIACLQQAVYHMLLHFGQKQGLDLILRGVPKQEVSQCFDLSALIVLHCSRLVARRFVRMIYHYLFLAFTPSIMALKTRHTHEALVIFHSGIDITQTNWLTHNVHSQHA